MKHDTVQRIRVVCIPFIIVVSSIAQDIVNTIIPPATIFEALALNHDIATKKKPKYRSPTSLVPSPDKTMMYIGEQTAKKITEYDLVAKAVKRRIDLPNEVTGITITADGKTIYATCASELWPSGVVCVIDVITGSIINCISDIGHFSRCPVLTPDKKKLYVVNVFSNDLAVISTVSNKVIKRVDMVREPYAAAITPDGKRLVVGNSIPNDRATDSEFVSCEISIYDTDADKVLKNIRLTRGSHSIFGVAVSPDGKYAFATHLIGKFNLVASQMENGWIHTNNIAVINIDNLAFVNDVSLDKSKKGSSNPWEITFATDGFEADSFFMCVSHAGSNCISMIKYKPFIETVLEKTAAGIDMGQRFTDLTEEIRKIVDIKSKGTRAIAAVGNKIYTAGYYDDENAVMEEHEITTVTDIGFFSEPVTHKIGTPVPQTGERLGERYYYDADLCMQEWQSCHSCHPFARPDALNWLLSEQSPSPKNAKSMLYSWWTPPTAWSGRRENARASIIAGVQIELGMSADPAVTVPMDTFFMYLKPVPSPYLVKGRLSEAAQQGRIIYYDSSKVDCIECHKGPLFFDDQKYNILDDPFDPEAMNTPGLNECWRTAPYGHTGEYKEVLEILNVDAHSNMRFNLSNGILTEDDIYNLEQYILSL